MILFSQILDGKAKCRLHRTKLKWESCVNCQRQESYPVVPISNYIEHLVTAHYENDIFLLEYFKILCFARRYCIVSLLCTGFEVCPKRYLQLYWSSHCLQVIDKMLNLLWNLQCCPLKRLWNLKSEICLVAGLSALSARFYYCYVSRKRAAPGSSGHDNHYIWRNSHFLKSYTCHQDKDKGGQFVHRMKLELERTC
jgi:hypothetical protein